MARVTHTSAVNYTNLSAGAKTAVDTAVAAIRAAYTAAKAEGRKDNVQAVLTEILVGQEET